MVEEFKVIADLIKQLGADGKQAFMWWLIYRGIVDLSYVIIPALALVSVARRVIAGIKSYKKEVREQARGE